MKTAPKEGISWLRFMMFSDGNDLRPAADVALRAFKKSFGVGEPEHRSVSICHRH
jgi:hypothetical protein